MDLYLGTAMLGLGAGALYAGLAYGLVLTHRGSGVVNFGHGAIAMYVAYVFAELRQAGRYVVPPLPNPLGPVEGVAGLAGIELDLPSLPTFVDLGARQTLPSALVLSLLTAVGLGLVLHTLVFRPLRHAPGLAKVVASVGIMLTLQAIATRRFGSSSRAVPAILPTGSVEVLGQQIPVNRFILAAVAVAVAAVLAGLFRFTTLGWATQAAAENEKGAILSGRSPSRLAAGTWAVASLIAGGFGILFSTLTALTPTNFSLFIIPALAAALLARFSSFWLALAAGMGIGLLEQVSPLLSRDLTFLPSTGLGRGLPLILILVVLFLRSDAIPSRGEILEEDLPPADVMRRPLVNLGAFAAVAAVVVVVAPYAYRGALINTFIGIVIALSLVLLVGLVGQPSLMQMAVAGMASLAMTRIAGGWGVPFPLAPILAALVAMVLGALIAVPALRIRGVQLAIVTLATAVAFEAMVLRNPSILSDAASSGSVPAPSLLGVGLGVNDPFLIDRHGVPTPTFGLLTLAVAMLACAGVVRMRNGPLGRLFLAVRSNERSAAAAGINVALVKSLGFGYAALLAGLAGGLSAYRFEGTSAASFTAFASLAVLAAAYLGGISTVGGAVVAGFLVTGGVSTQVTIDLFDDASLEPLLAGLGLVLTAVLNPRGIAGGVVGLTRLLASRRRPRTVVAAPVGVLDAGA